jgi:hypothetical protein
MTWKTLAEHPFFTESLAQVSLRKQPQFEIFAAGLRARPGQWRVPLGGKPQVSDFLEAGVEPPTPEAPQLPRLEDASMGAAASGLSAPQARAISDQPVQRSDQRSDPFAQPRTPVAPQPIETQNVHPVGVPGPDATLETGEVPTPGPIAQTKSGTYLPKRALEAAGTDVLAIDGGVVSASSSASRQAGEATSPITTAASCTAAAAVAAAGGMSEPALASTAALAGVSQPLLLHPAGPTSGPATSTQQRLPAPRSASHAGRTVSGSSFSGSAAHYRPAQAARRKQDRLEAK